MRDFSKITPSGPASAWTAKANKRVQFSYLVFRQADNCSDDMPSRRPRGSAVLLEVFTQWHGGYPLHNRAIRSIVNTLS